MEIGMVVLEIWEERVRVMPKKLGGVMGTYSVPLKSKVEPQNSFKTFIEDSCRIGTAKNA